METDRVMLRERDFREIRLLRDWIFSCIRVLGDLEVDRIYMYDSIHLESSESLCGLRGFRENLEKVYGLWLSGKSFYPFERLVGLGRESVVGDMESYLAGSSQVFHSGMSREESITALGRLIETTQDEKIKQSYVNLFFEASGLTKGGGVSIDNSSKTVVLDKHMAAAKELVERYSSLEVKG